MLLQFISVVRWVLSSWNSCIDRTSSRSDLVVYSLTALCVACGKAPSDRPALLCSQAMKERKRCITAHWLNTVLKKKKLVPPHRALHFPVAFPPGGKPCSQHVRLPPPPWTE